MDMLPQFNDTTANKWNNCDLIKMDKNLKNGKKNGQNFDNET